MTTYYIGTHNPAPSMTKTFGDSIVGLTAAIAAAVDSYLATGRPVDVYNADHKGRPAGYAGTLVATIK